MNSVVAAVTGWLDVLLLFAAVLCAVVADARRQATAPEGSCGGVPTAVQAWTWAALGLTVVAATGVVVRFLNVLL